MKITEYMKNHTVYLDGGTGTMLQAMGLRAGEPTERWNITHPDCVREVHLAYYNAGSNIVSANTFGANILKFSAEELDEIISLAIGHVRYAAQTCKYDQPKWVALDIGPTGRMLKPLGDLDFEDAVEIFAKTVRLGVKHGADLFFIQTMNDSLETKAALLAVKENSDLPVFVANAYGGDGKLMTGASPAAMVAMLEGMGADAIGVNCSLGPKSLSSVVDEYLKYSSLPIIVKPNAGMPTEIGGETTYSLSPSDFADEIASMAERGVGIIGGCCGTTPEYVKTTVEKTKNIAHKAITDKKISLVSSYTHAVEIGKQPIIIGERINPTGKPLFKAALRQGDMEYILREAIMQEERGAHILDVNIGLPEIDEAALLPRVISEIQAVTNLPLQIDSSDAKAMEAALRRYNGKALINSVNGKTESMDAVFPLMKKYGGMAVALTLDGDGIPDSAEKRFEIAERIIARAADYGIDKRQLIFDPLAMAVSADPTAPEVTLRTVQMISERLGCHTVLGISNVSFGLPRRDIINAAFLTTALSRGLSAAIINPASVEAMKAYRAYLALSGQDEGCGEYISFAETVAEEAKSVSCDKKDESGECGNLSTAISRGLKARAQAITSELLSKMQPMDIVNNEIIPTLNRIGEGFERGSVYLPQLLMSAESAKAAFEVIKSAMPEGEGSKAKIVLATVEGDVHDIGKNIVRLLLENYGYAVIDLGKNVSKDRIVEAVLESGAELVGLSALMTTTVPAMEATIAALRVHAPGCKVMVGGAVLTEEYAVRIGADGYAADAMEAVRLADKLIVE